MRLSWFKSSARRAHRQSNSQGGVDFSSPFLLLLAKDIANHPDKLRAFPPALACTIAELTANIGSDYGAQIEGDVDL